MLPIDFDVKLFTKITHNIRVNYPMTGLLAIAIYLAIQFFPSILNIFIITYLMAQIISCGHYNLYNPNNILHFRHRDFHKYTFVYMKNIFYATVCLFMIFILGVIGKFISAFVFFITLLATLPLFFVYFSIKFGQIMDIPSENSFETVWNQTKKFFFPASINLLIAFLFTILSGIPLGGISQEIFQNLLGVSSRNSGFMIFSIYFTTIFFNISSVIGVHYYKKHEN